MRVWLHVGILAAGLTGGASRACAVERSVQVCVQDERGQAIAGAMVRVQGDSSQGVTSDLSGCTTLNADSKAVVTITRDGFVREVHAMGDGSRLVVVMQVAEDVQEVEVTA